MGDIIGCIIGGMGGILGANGFISRAAKGFILAIPIGIPPRRPGIPIPGIPCIPGIPANGMGPPPPPISILSPGGTGGYAPPGLIICLALSMILMLGAVYCVGAGSVSDAV